MMVSILSVTINIDRSESLWQPAGLRLYPCQWNNCVLNSGFHLLNSILQWFSGIEARIQASLLLQEKLPS
jgi:hypothetical protein